jgi:hypothetical protein
MHEEAEEAHLNTRPRRAIQELFDEIIKPLLRPVRQGYEVILMVDEIVVPDIKRLLGIDPIEHAQVVADWRWGKSS